MLVVPASIVETLVPVSKSAFKTTFTVVASESVRIIGVSCSLALAALTVAIAPLLKTSSSPGTNLNIFRTRSQLQADSIFGIAVGSINFQLYICKW